MDSKDLYIEQLEDLIKYQFGYNLIMKYWNYIPESEKAEVDKQLKKMGL